MYKKFLIGMAALCVSLFFIGCETEVEKIVNTTTPDDGIYYPVVATDEDELRAVLASGLEGAIAYRGTGGETFLAKLEIPEHRTVGFFSDVTPHTGGLDIKGTVYVEAGGKLTAAATSKITVTGSLYVKAGGTLVTDAATSVSNGEAGGTALGTGAAHIAGTLEINVANTTEAHAAFDYVSPNSSAPVILHASAKASAFNDISVPSGKLVVLATATPETEATLSVPAGLALVLESAATTTALTALTVNGSLYVEAASFGASGGLKITVGNGAVAHLGTVPKLAAESTVAAGGKLNVVITDMNSLTLAASGGATVNGITFPESDAPFAISAITALGVEVKDSFEVPEGWTLTGPLVIPAGKVLTLTKDLVLGNRIESGIPGSLSASLSSGSVTLAAATGEGGAKTAGSGKIIVADTEIEGVWQAVGSSDAVTIALAGNTASSITGTTNAVLTAGTGGKITQNAGAGNNLTIAANTTINLATAGSVVLKKATTASDNALVTLGAATAILKFGTGVTDGNATKAQLQAALTPKGVTVGDSVTGKTTKNADATGTLTQIIGANATNTLTGPASTGTDATIDSTLTVDNS